MIVNSDNIQFFLEIFLALEAAVLGWYQPHVINKAVTRTSDLLLEYRKCNNDQNKINQEYIEGATKDLKKLKNKERINNILIGVGKWVIALLSLSILLFLVVANLADLYYIKIISSFCKRINTLFILEIVLFLFIGFKIWFLHYRCYRFSRDREKHYKQLMDHMIISPSSSPMNFSKQDI